ncbi:PREDICTED: serine/threonine-protein kinase STY8-like [Prunus mume]|uniref:Serine/threonine-protein kinase STY8-like n=1 Tax=Prunus mume TaxID=102107 RepID=A0ABM0PS70_PRUMU|nr:PREDICTED: serine/threonine-protein kinase STY8-like [Prunus mume]
MDLTEGVGESSSPPRSFVSFSNYDVRNDVYNRLLESGKEDALTQPDFREQLDAHFNRLPASYGLDVNLDRVEDVLLHQKLLALAKDPEKRPVYHIRFMENTSTKADDDDDDDDNDGQQVTSIISTSRPSCGEANEGAAQSHDRARNCAIDSKLGDLNLDVRTNATDMDGRHLTESFPPRQDIPHVPIHEVIFSTIDKPKLLSQLHYMQYIVSTLAVSWYSLISMQDIPHVPIHEVIFSTIDKPKLLSQLSALLSDLGLNIREAHVFSTTDGYSLDVFVVDGWPVEDTDGLHEAMEKAVARSEGSWSRSSHSHSAVEKALAAQEKPGNWEIDRRLLKIGDRIASGSCGDLYRGIYLGQDVAVKILRSEHLNDALEDEFAQEVAILRKVHHRNVVCFIGACTKSPHLCIVTEYMPGGSLYDYLHKNHNVLKLSELLKFAIDVCKGMEYLHHKNIIHRDLKTANLLMDTNNVVKVADFGVARFQNQEGVMTAETGTYRWMAPEVINHQPYDQKADVFSFAIVLWELVTAKVPYDTMTPLQAALGVRQGLRPDLPSTGHPKLLELMQKCWDADPSNRPSFSDIIAELEYLLQEVQVGRSLSSLFSGLIAPRSLGPTVN